jgi:hypothetical protein
MPVGAELGGEERWRPVVGFEDSYAVSDRGRVKSLQRVIERRNGRPQSVRERVLRATPLRLPAARGGRRSGLRQVGLYLGGRRTAYYVHVLMRQAFPEAGSVSVEGGSSTSAAFNNSAASRRRRRRRHRPMLRRPAAS